MTAEELRQKIRDWCSDTAASRPSVLEFCLDLLGHERELSRDRAEFDQEIAEKFDLWTFPEVLEYAEQKERERLTSACLANVLVWGVRGGATLEDLRLRLAHQHPELAEQVREVELDGRLNLLD